MLLTMLLCEVPSRKRVAPVLPTTIHGSTCRQQFKRDLRRIEKDTEWQDSDFAALQVLLGNTSHVSAACLTRLYSVHYPH